jgi:hypothetical protein
MMNDILSAEETKKYRENNYTTENDTVINLTAGKGQFTHCLILD